MNKKEIEKDVLRIAKKAKQASLKVSLLSSKEKKETIVEYYILNLSFCPYVIPSQI